MSLKDRARIRAEATEEGRQDVEQEVQIQQRLRNWKRRTMWLGVALALCIGVIALFSEGQPLHQYAGASTKFLVYLAMCLLAVFMYAAGTSYVVCGTIFGTSGRFIRSSHRLVADTAQASDRGRKSGALILLIP